MFLLPPRVGSRQRDQIFKNLSYFLLPSTGSYSFCIKEILKKYHALEVLKYMEIFCLEKNAYFFLDSFLQTVSDTKSVWNQGTKVGEIFENRIALRGGGMTSCPVAPPPTLQTIERKRRQLWRLVFVLLIKLWHVNFLSPLPSYHSLSLSLLSNWAMKQANIQNICS